MCRCSRALRGWLSKTSASHRRKKLNMVQLLLQCNMTSSGMYVIGCAGQSHTSKHACKSVPPTGLLGLCFTVSLVHETNHPYQHSLLPCFNAGQMSVWMCTEDVWEFQVYPGKCSTSLQLISTGVCTGWAGWGWCALVVQHSFSQIHMAVTLNSPHLHFLTMMQALTLTCVSRG